MKVAGAVTTAHHRPEDPPLTLQPPEYFEQIRRTARERWKMLDSDAELAAPWWQLFRQVSSSPRHVISELLQNADDAGATWARATLIGGALVFEHDGEDFDETTFRSLCRFGFSNKRRLHTIGFRGIGFRSVFSLGPLVQVHTPTLSIAFERQRFTEPRWLRDRVVTDHTIVRVRIDDPNKLQQMQHEIDRWAADPVSLLFFRAIQQLQLEGMTVTKIIEGPGPIVRSAWVRLDA